MKKLMLLMGFLIALTVEAQQCYYETKLSMILCPPSSSSSSTGIVSTYTWAEIEAGTVGTSDITSNMTWAQIEAL